MTRAVHRVCVSSVPEGQRITETGDYGKAAEAVAMYMMNHDRLRDELMDTAKNEEGKLKVVYTFGIGWERADFHLTGTNFDQHAWCEIANVLAN